MFKDCIKKLTNLGDIEHNSLKTKLCTPLEKLYPKTFGNLDEGQKILIKHGSNDLVLIENASDFVAKIKEIPGLFEKIIENIIKQNDSNIVSLGSYSLVIGDKKEDFSIAKLEKMSHFKKFIDKVKSKSNLLQKQSTNFILHLGLDFKVGGHYGIIIKQDNNVLVFDSMQKNGESHYSDYFMLVAKKLFGETNRPRGHTKKREQSSTARRQPEDYDTYNYIISTTPSTSECLQLTGGFINDYNPKYDTSYETWLEKIQNTDSQNHFCYMWSLWYFHGIMMRKNINREITKIYERNQEPLAIIKRYIFSVLCYLTKSYKGMADFFYENILAKNYEGINTDEKKFLLLFFLVHFRYIWDKINNDGIFKRYVIMNCDMFTTFKNINECWEYSIRIEPFLEDNFCK